MEVSDAANAHNKGKTLLCATKLNKVWKQSLVYVILTIQEKWGCYNAIGERESLYYTGHL